MIAGKHYVVLFILLALFVLGVFSYFMSFDSIQIDQGNEFVITTGDFVGMNMEELQLLRAKKVVEIDLMRSELDALVKSMKGIDSAYDYLKCQMVGFNESDFCVNVVNGTGF